MPEQAEQEKLAPEIFEKPQSAHVGANAKRSCTNCCAFILFVLVWVGFVAFSIVAFKNGDIYRLINGVDYLGNVCGRGTPNNVTAAVTADWAAYQYLYYPIGFNPATGAFQIAGAKDLGVCVKACPNSVVGREVATYSENPPANLPASYYAWFNTASKFNRCVPSFDCSNVFNEAGNGNGTATTTTKVPTTTTADNGSSSPAGALARCEANKGDASAVFDTLAGFGDVARQGFNEVRQRWWVLVVCALLTLVFSFLWMIILNRAVKPVVAVTLVLVLVTVGLIAGLCLREWSRIKATPAPDADQERMYLGIGVGAAIVEFLLICIILYIRTDIMIACDIIEEAAQIPVAIKTMIAVPPVLVALMLASTIYFLFVAANVYTAADSISFPTPALTYNGTLTTGLQIDVRQQRFSNWRPFGFAFTIFMFLWTYGFFNAVGFMIVAFCAVFWYWSNPGSPKNPQFGVGKAVGLTLRYHLGTLALGSLIIAVIQALRIMMSWMEHRLRAAGKRSDGVRCIICCAQCCLGCFEAVIKFVNRNAYIVQTMTGEPFMTAARHALSLLTSNVVAVIGVTLISEYVMFFSKIVLTGASLGVGFGILSAMDGFSSAGVIFMLVFIGLVCYFVASVFLGIFGVCIDSITISYCYDLEQNNGTARPYFFPEDLRKHLDTAKARMADKATTDQKKEFEASQDYRQVDH